VAVIRKLVSIYWLVCPVGFSARTSPNLFLNNSWPLLGIQSNVKVLWMTVCIEQFNPWFVIRKGYRLLHFLTNTYPLAILGRLWRRTQNYLREGGRGQAQTSTAISHDSPVSGRVTDPRTKDWMLMSGPVPLLTILITYFYFCTSAGPRWMKDRKPFDLKYVLMVYNASQVAFSIWLVYEVRHPVSPPQGSVFVSLLLPFLLLPDTPCLFKIIHLDFALWFSLFRQLLGARVFIHHMLRAFFSGFRISSETINPLCTWQLPFHWSSTHRQRFTILSLEHCQAWQTNTCTLKKTMLVKILKFVSLSQGWPTCSKICHTCRTRGYHSNA
jgi:hypothetical protein